MQDVAALAGVSLKTVSRVVNGEPGVSGDLVRRVERAVNQLDYQHNLAASSLRRSDRKTATIGLLLEDVANPFSSAIHRVIEDASHDRGIAVLAGSLDEDPERERRLVAAFVSRRVDGLILAPAGADHGYLLNERRVGMPIVFIDRPPLFLDADAVLDCERGGSVRGRPAYASARPRTACLPGRSRSHHHRPGASRRVSTGIVGRGGRGG